MEAGHVCSRSKELCYTRALLPLALLLYLVAASEDGLCHYPSRYSSLKALGNVICLIFVSNLALNSEMV